MSRVVGAKGWRWWRTSQILTPSTDADSWQRSESTSTGEVRLNFCRCANKTLKTNQVAICSVRRARSSRPLRHYDDWRVFRSLIPHFSAELYAPCIPAAGITTDKQWRIISNTDTGRATRLTSKVQVPEARNKLRPTLRGYTRAVNKHMSSYHSKAFKCFWNTDSPLRKTHKTHHPDRRKNTFLFSLFRRMLVTQKASNLKEKIINIIVMNHICIDT